VRVSRGRGARVYLTERARGLMGWVPRLVKARSGVATLRSTCWSVASGRGSQLSGVFPLNESNQF
jgi:hypothetical protein